MLTEHLMTLSRTQARPPADTTRKSPCLLGTPVDIGTYDSRNQIAYAQSRAKECAHCKIENVPSRSEPICKGHNNTSAADKGVRCRRTSSLAAVLVEAQPKRNVNLIDQCHARPEAPARLATRRAARRAHDLGAAVISSQTRPPSSKYDPLSPRSFPPQVLQWSRQKPPKKTARCGARRRDDKADHGHRLLTELSPVEPP